MNIDIALVLYVIAFGIACVFLTAVYVDKHLSDEFYDDDHEDPNDDFKDDIR